MFTRQMYYADVRGATECSIFPSKKPYKKRTYKNITPSSKKRISYLLSKYAISQYAHVYPYIDVFATFSPKGEL